MNTMTTDESLSVFREPCCLIENCSDGTLKTCSDVLNQLRKISSPLNVISITGPCRTGKSYLLNRLAGKLEGFLVASTIEASTKGIWVWCRPHPKRPNEVILLLDTEGLGDIMKGNDENDIWIFAISVLLSSTLVYNCMNTIGQDGLSKLHYVTELTQRIKTKSTPSDKDGDDFFRIFPNFVWVVRDARFSLKIKGQPITPDEYLAAALELKKGTGKAVDDYNRPRQCITNFFQDKKCFIFPIPAKEPEKMEELENIPESELNPKFLYEAERFTSYIYRETFPKTANGQPINGRMFCNLLESYISAIQKGEIPCVEDAVKTMAEKENEHPLKEEIGKKFSKICREKSKDREGAESKRRRSMRLKKMDPAGDIDIQKEELDSQQEIQKDERGGELKKELAGKTEDPAWKGEIHDIFLGEFCKEKLEEFLSVKRTESVLTNLLHVILAKNNKEALSIMMVSISKKWKEDFSDNTISVWLGYDHRGKKTGQMVLVCFHSAVALSKFSQYLGFPMIYRRFDETEMEPLENRLQQKYRTVSFKKKDVEIIKRLINEHGEYLFNLHSNLEAITASSVKSTKKGIINKTSILLYCRLKGVIPYGEEFFPKQLKVDDQDYLTDIREGFFSLGMNPAQRLPSNPHPHFLNNPLRMGCSIGASGFPFAGTIGPFVRFGASEIGFLTCAHVLGITRSRTKWPVVQPSDIESGLPDGTRLCGTFEREIFDSSKKIGVDAALVCIDQTKRGFDLGKFVWMGSDQPKKIGMFEGNSPSFENGMVIGNPDLQNLGGMRDVCKFGRSTGLTQGLLVLENAMLKVHSATLALPDRMPLPPGCTHNTFIMKGQFLIQNVGNEPFFIPGDSGAGVYVVKRDQQGESKLALIGIAIGSLTSGECAMTPIGTVLEALGLKESNIITEGVMEIGP